MSKPAPETAAAERPEYERPSIKEMTEREILKTFQITQSMTSWWNSSVC